MHAWEAIQKTLDYIEENISENTEIEELAKIAALSPFYYQRLFSRLVNKPVREYIKLRRLARASEMLKANVYRIYEIAERCGFKCQETFSRTFKDNYWVTPSEYKNGTFKLNHFDKPDLLLGYVMIDEGVPLISEGLVLEINRAKLDDPIDFIGVSGHVCRHCGENPMSGEDYCKIYVHNKSYIDGYKQRNVIYIDIAKNIAVAKIVFFNPEGRYTATIYFTLRQDSSSSSWKIINGNYNN